jgi:hypothetical protein
MSESESIKADIAFHEKMFFSAIAALMALIGWMASNYMTVSILIMMLIFSKVNKFRVKKDEDGLRWVCASATKYIGHEN